MERIEITWGKAVRVWWSYIWRVIVFSMILCTLLALIAPFIFFPLGIPEFGRKYGLQLALLGVIPISIWGFKKVLSKKFKGFSVVLIKDSNL